MLKMTKLFLLAVMLVSFVPSLFAGNKIGDYDITLSGLNWDYANNRTTFTYIVRGDGNGKDLSHWSVALCNNHTGASATPTPNEVVLDPTLQIYGMKWDVSVKIYQTKTFTLTLPGIWDTTQVVAGVKAGQNLHYGTVTGPACTTINPKSSIGDRIWFDTDGDGVQDAGENGVAGVTVKLYSCDNTLVATTVSNASGNYLFSNLTPGDYYIKVEPSSEYVVTEINEGSDDTKDSDVSPSTGKSGCTTLSPNENDMKWDAGLIFAPVPEGKIGDKVWNDLNFNGIQNDGEPGIANVTVKLYDCNNNLLETTTTDATGKYEFDGLAAGSYYVEFTLPSGFVFTTKNAGSDDEKDSDADVTTGKTVCYNLGNNDEIETIDAGMYDPLTMKASIGNYFWNDANANGLQDNTESGIAGATVRLLDCSSNVLATTTTNSNGDYSFTNLTPGDYVVEFVTPSGFVFTSYNSGLDDTKDSDVDPGTGRTICVNLSPGENDNTWDAGAYVPVTCANDWTGSLGPDSAICLFTPQWITISGSVDLMPPATRAQLQLTWRVVKPSSINNCPPGFDPCDQEHYTTKWIYGDTTFTMQAWWPGVSPTDTLVEIHYGMNVLDCDGNPIKNGIGRDLYWNPSVCPPPNSPEADLSLSKTVSNPTPQNGETIQYTIVLNNAGPGTATGVQVSDVLPSGVVFVSASPSVGSFDINTNLWTVASLAPNTSATVVISARVDIALMNSVSFDLGVAKDYNLFVLNDYTAPSSDTEGKVAVGNDCRISSYSVGDKLPNSGGTEDVLVVGHNLYFTSGRVYHGNVVYGNYAEVTPYVASIMEGTLRKDTVIDFQAAAAHLLSLSSQFAAYGVNGSAGLQFGKLALHGSDPSLNVFKIWGDTLGMANDFEINVPNGSSVLVNIFGSYAEWKGGLNVYGTPYSNVLYNFVEADSIKISNIDVRGSILAPRTNVNFVSGVQNGQMVAKNVKGIGQYNLILFRGNIPVDTTVVNVAEVVAAVQHDPDSSPNNHLATEDDIASASIIIDREINSTSGTNYNWQQISTVGFNQIILTITTDQNGNLLAGTYGGGIFRSTNGGVEWTQINSNMLSVYVWSLISVPGGKIYAGTESGIYATTDNGNTWFVAGLSNNDVRALLTDNNGRIFAGVWGRGVFYTDDFGASWTEFNTGLTDLAVHALAKNTNGDIYAGTMGGGVHKLSIGSGSWMHLNSNPVSRFIWSLTVNGNGDVYAGTYGDGVIRSLDGGASWERISTGLTAAHIYAIGHDANNNIFASAWGSGVFMLPAVVTDRLSGNWVDFGLSGKNISSIAVNSATNQVIAGTESGDLFKTDIVNGITDNSTLPTEFKLFQNYPNPFNPATVIEFTLPAVQEVKLVVYNILGQQIKVLNDGQLNAGYHKYTFDGKGLASGVYFYRLVAGQFTEVKKMILQK